MLYYTTLYYVILIREFNYSYILLHRNMSSVGREGGIPYLVKGSASEFMLRIVSTTRFIKVTIYFEQKAMHSQKTLNISAVIKICLKPNILMTFWVECTRQMKVIPSSSLLSFFRTDWSLTPEKIHSTSV